jgi:hypothetical protein
LEHRGERNLEARELFRPKHVAGLRGQLHRSHELLAAASIDANDVEVGSRSRA